MAHGQRVGRPNKSNNIVFSEIAGYVSNGSSFKDAALLAGISESTFYEWKKQFPEFLESLKKAEMECKAARVATIFKASEKSWQAAAWWLERRYPKEYGRQMESEKEMPPVFFGFPAGSQFIQSEEAVPVQAPRKKSVVAAVHGRL